MSACFGVISDVTRMKKTGTMNIAATTIRTVWSMNARRIRWRRVACGTGRATIWSALVNVAVPVRTLT